MANESNNIKYIKGDIFTAKTQAIVNPVNCVGVMGKGLALKFKQKYPDCFISYQKECSEGRIVLGKVFVFDNKTKCPRYILCFPTKDHWRDSSILDNIERGMNNLVFSVFLDYNINSIAIPALGCGLGGLLWSEVKPIIHKYMSKFNIKTLIYEPI